MAVMRFEVFERRTLFGRRWFWRLRAKNGEIISQSEAYNSRAAAAKTINTVIEQAGGAEIHYIDSDTVARRTG